MTSKAALLALLTLWGVGAAVPHQAWADEITSEQSADGDDDSSPDLTNRVWVKAGEDKALPGVIKIFLSATARWCRIPAGKPTACRPGRRPPPTR